MDVTWIDVPSRQPERGAAYLASCLRGECLYGDDFSAEELEAWFADERDASHRLMSQGRAYSYEFHALNRRHGFRWLPAGRFEQVLCLGGARGEELQPLAERVGMVTILEAAEGFRGEAAPSLGVRYEAASPQGLLPFPDASFDLTTCLGVLHHIANVSAVVGEIARCLRPGGYVLLREPIVSMGHLGLPRPGLTPRERGVPLHLLRALVAEAGLRIVRETRCMFSVTGRIFGWLPGHVYNRGLAVAVDELLCRLPVWSRAYHAESLVARARPSSVFLVLRREG